MEEFVPTRNVAFARVFTGAKDPVLPADLSDDLYGRGFMPGFTDPDAKTAPLVYAGLADARFVVGGEGFRIVNLTSSRGDGCRITVHAAEAADLPDDYLARRTVPRPRLCYIITAGGPAHSDRNLCENMAESLMLSTNGVVELGGLGMKGNRPTLYNSSWVGKIKTMPKSGE